jgi:hypothetical protein
MRDGVTLSADVYRPVAEGRHPAIVEHIPYRKDDITGPGRWAIYQELAARGLAVVRVDVRGTGNSGGVALDEYTESEQEDGCEIIAWVASREWCTGAVGAWGMSYGGFTAIQLAARRPPALRAIAALYATDDRYTDDMHFFGGALCALELGHYPIRMIAMNALPPAGPLDDERRAAWRERIERTPAWVVRWLEQQRDGAYWRNGSLRPDVGRIVCPALIVGGWRDGYCNAAVRMAASLPGPTEVVIGPWSHVLPDRAPVGPRIDLVGLLTSWFAKTLGDMDRGPGPKVRVFVQGFDEPGKSPQRISGHWRGYDRWPEPEDVLVLHLGPDRTLARTPADDRVEVALPAAPHAGVQTGNWCPPPPPDGLPGDQRLDEALAETFETAELDKELVCLGFPRVRLSVRHDGPTATIAVKLADVGPRGASQLVTRSVMNLSHRDGHESPRPLAAGSFVPVSLELNATAWRFSAGHRLRLAVSAADWPTVWPAPTTEPPTLLVDGTARLELPLAQAGNRLDDDAPPSPPEIDGARAAVLPGRWRVVRDGLAHIAGIETSWGVVHNDVATSTRVRESLAVSALTSEHDPFGACVEAEGCFDLERPDVRVRSVARGRFTSSPSAFRAELELDVTVDSEAFAARRWNAEIPRDLV